MTSHLHNPPPTLVTATTPIVIKISSESGEVKKLRLPLRDLDADILPSKLRHALKLQAHQQVIFERFSDSLGGYVKLDKSNRDVYKSLQRAAKAKLKLRIKATMVKDTVDSPEHMASTTPVADPLEHITATVSAVDPLEHITATVPSAPPAASHQATLDKLARLQKHNTVRKTESSQEDCAIKTAPSPAIDIPTPSVATSLADKVFTTQEVPAVEPHDPTRLPSSWIICCNKCDMTLTNTHFHCSICDAGDFDLCESCVDKGAMCTGKDHWLVKRSISNGQITSSVTERLAPKTAKAPVSDVIKPCKPLSIVQPAAYKTAEEVKLSPKTPKIPGAFTIEPRQLCVDAEPRRTCNGCIESGKEQEFVNCKDCEDYDLCIKCHVEGRHGHHPAHSFQRAVDTVKMTPFQQSLLAPARSLVHEAVCDGCDKTICGVRHKCFECPDFDYCNDCVKGSNLTHPKHRFAPIYEALANPGIEEAACHKGVLCDGPECKSKPRQNFIRGVRYKCAVCDDIDLCANCEALPGSGHNKTHPLLKITTPMRGINISTLQQNAMGESVAQLGDKQWHASPVSAAATVKTVADIEPSSEAKPAATESLRAFFVADTIEDGTEVAPGTRHFQTWTLRNPGPTTWPAGCSVQYVGGDNVLDVDVTHASAASVMADAMRSGKTDHAVLPGHKHDFKVAILAPARTGKAISYWRLKTPDGCPFGHRLWSHIVVVKPELRAPSMNVGTSKPFAGPGIEHASALAEYETQLELLRLRNMQRMSRMQTSDPSLQSYYTKYQERMKLLRAATASNKPEARSCCFVPQPAGVKVDLVQPLVNEKANPATATASVSATATAAGSQTPTQPDTMVFPTLERESPASSMSQLATGRLSLGDSICSGSTKTSRPVTPLGGEGFDDLGDELEVMSADEDSDSGSDHGEFTDDEYDILDASDQETVASS